MRDYPSLKHFVRSFGLIVGLLIALLIGLGAGSRVQAAGNPSRLIALKAVCENLLGAGLGVVEKWSGRAAIPPQTREVIHNLEKSVVNRNGKPYRVVHAESPDNLVINLVDSDSQYAGSIFYHTADDLLYIDNMDSYVRGRGVGKLAIAEVVKSHPETQVIKASVAVDNLKSAKAAFAATHDCETAVKATHFYVAFAALGFKKVLSFACPDTGNYSIELGR